MIKSLPSLTQLNEQSIWMAQNGYSVDPKKFLKNVQDAVLAGLKVKYPGAKVMNEFGYIPSTKTDVGDARDTWGAIQFETSFTAPSRLPIKVSGFVTIDFKGPEPSSMKIKKVTMLCKEGGRQARPIENMEMTLKEFTKAIADGIGRVWEALDKARKERRTSGPQSTDPNSAQSKGDDYSI